MCVHEEWIVGPQSTAFYTQLWTPASGTAQAHLIYVHGFGEHLGRYEDIFPKWVARGISIFVYDQRGFGKTALDDEHKSPTSRWCRSCWADQMEDLDFFVSREASRIGDDVPLFLMGFSMASVFIAQ